MKYESSVEIASRLHAIIDNAIDGIITIDMRGIVESINPAAAQLFGYEPQEVIGHNIKMLMPTPHHEQHDTYLDNYQRTRHAKIIGIGREVKGKRKDKNLFPFRLSVSETHLETRTIYTGVIHDLSKQKVAEEKLLVLNQQLEAKVEARTDDLAKAVEKLMLANKQLEKEINQRKGVEATLRETEQEIRKALEKEIQLNELKSRFVSMASHEFRTPLSTILSSASLIARYEDAQGQTRREKHVKRIKSSVKNLTGILNDFLSLSKLEEGKFNLNWEDFELMQLCGEVSEEIQGMLKKDQILVMDKNVEQLYIHSDKRVLKNILFNLISNAIKYSSEGQNITCSIKTKGDILQLRIKDEGIGIPEEDQKFMFERFFRAGNVTNIQGTGLGLNIVKRYAELLGGQISFRSKLGEGTSFKVSIPLNKAKSNA